MSLKFSPFVLRHAGAEAGLLVPRILTVLTGSGSAAESARAAFTKDWEGVPLSFLLPWAAQMLTLLDADGGEVLLPALKVSGAPGVALHVMPALLLSLMVSRADTGPRHGLRKTVATLAAHGRHLQYMVWFPSVCTWLAAAAALSHGTH